VIECSFAHWEDEKQKINSHIERILQKIYDYVATQKDKSTKKLSYKPPNSPYASYFVIKGDYVYFCLVDSRVDSQRPQAFLEDMKSRFEERRGEEGFTELISEVMKVYSPGYENKDLSKVRTAQRWLKTIKDRAEGNARSDFVAFPG